MVADLKRTTLKILQRPPPPSRKGRAGNLSAEFIIPPFTVLNAREGTWQDRKRLWISLGIRGELGRGEALLYSHEGVTTEGLNHYRKLNSICPGGSPRPATTLRADGRTARGDGVGKALKGGKHLARAYSRDIMRGEVGVGDIKSNGCIWPDRPPPDGAIVAARKPTAIPGGGTGKNSTWLFRTPEGYEASDAAQAQGYGTSIFDPVLCEITYRWFCPPGGAVLDPFAGEATKGVVAACLNHPYTGVELRPEQVAANVAQWADIAPLAAGLPHAPPTWLTGDSGQLRRLLPAGGSYDLIFTSPPYYDLEIYSQLEKDGSAFETYDRFMAWYNDIFKAACARLKPNRFCVVKVGDVRDEQGCYRNFVGDNVDCFRAAGLHYYNEAILVTAAGSLPLRTRKQFQSSRKLGKTHQNILVFYKGDPRKIREHFPCNIL